MSYFEKKTITNKTRQFGEAKQIPESNLTQIFKLLEKKCKRSVIYLKVNTA